MNQLTLENIIAKRHWLGLFAIIVSVVAWTAEFMGAVYVCPYCRVQRTVIGLLGVILLLPFAYHFLAKYLAITLGFFGAVVAAMQHFMGWKKISAGTFTFNDNIFIDPFLLSFCALFSIVGFTLIILHVKKPA